MKKIALAAVLLTVTACGGVDTSEENIKNKLAEAEKTVRDAADSLLAKFQGKADPTKTEQAKAETGETQIGETEAATETADAGEATPPTPPTPEEETIEQKVEAARKAVTTLVPAGQYRWENKNNGSTSTLTINPDGSVTEKVTSDRIYNGQLRKVGDDMCFEAQGSIRNCFAVSEPDESGAYKADGTNNNYKTVLTPMK